MEPATSFQPDLKTSGCKEGQIGRGSRTGTPARYLERAKKVSFVWVPLLYEMFIKLSRCPIATSAQ
jgi:hypothetical protein